MAGGATSTRARSGGSLKALLARSGTLLRPCNLAEHVGRSLAHHGDVDVQQVRDAHVVGVDHIARAQGVDESKRVVERLGATARSGDVASILKLSEHEVQERLGLFEERAQRVTAPCVDEVVGIHVIGQYHAAEVNVGTLDELDRALGGLLPGRVTIEEVDDPLGEAREGLHVVLRERGSERGDHVADTALPAGDSIGVALDHDRLILGDDVLFSPVKAVEVAFLVKEGRLCRVQVLGLAIPRDSPAERDAAALLVEDGEHDAVKEAIREAAVPRDRDVGVDHLPRREPRGAEVRYERAAPGRVTQSIALAHRGVELAFLAVRPAGIVLAPHEHRVEEGARLLAAGDEASTLGPGAPLALRVADLDVRPVGEVVDGLGEAQVLTLHDVLEGVAALAAAKAVPYLGGGDDVEARGLLTMKRAAAPELATARFELDGFLHELNQVRRSAHALDVLVRDHVGTSP